MTWLAWFFLACELAAVTIALLIYRIARQAQTARDEALERNEALWQLNKALIGSLLREIEPVDELAARRARQ